MDYDAIKTIVRTAFTCADVNVSPEDTEILEDLIAKGIAEELKKEPCLVQIVVKGPVENPQQFGEEMIKGLLELIGEAPSEIASEDSREITGT